MSLKSFHLVFVVASFLLALFVAGWSVNQYVAHGQRVADLALGMFCLAGAVGLVFYGRYVMRKLKNIDYF